MSYTAALNAVYNHYLTSYAPRKTSSPYDTHKKSELRSIYNSIVKLNKEAPLYILDTSKESRAYAVGLKENARALRNTIASLGGLNEDEMLGKKVAYSSNENIVSAAYIGERNTGKMSPTFNVEVTQMASNQVNMGTFLPSDEKALLAPDLYSFDVTINDLNYEFQFSVRENETNHEIQERLARLISNAEIGISADVLEDGDGKSSLRLTSTATGVKDNKDYIFSVSDNKTSRRMGTVDYLGLSYTARKPANAEFLVNGEPRSAASNHFNVGKMFEVTINGISPAEGETAEVGLKTDLDSLAENVGSLIGGYNSFIQSATEYQDRHPKSGRLLREMASMSLHYQPKLEKLGFSFEKNGLIALDDNEFKHSLSGNTGLQDFSTIKDFTNSILRKTSQISLNPMEYVDKTLVAYKNPGKNFITPYITSNYSGMLFNDYC